MNPDSAFFLEILAFQFVFTTAVIALIGRRFPRRVRRYRLIAPAAVPLMMATLAIFSYVTVMREHGATPETETIARLVLAYMVLWLAGVMLAGIVTRLVLRRPRR